MKQKLQKISVLTAYDYSTASICDRAGVDILLVGDSAAMVMLGYARYKSDKHGRDADILQCCLTRSKESNDNC